MYLFLLKTHLNQNENKDQQGKGTLTERSPRHNPATPAGHPEGNGIGEKTWKGRKGRVDCFCLNKRDYIKHFREETLRSNI
jgi:hypothetical protein